MAATGAPDAAPVALITGGSGGLGAAICAVLATAGFRVAIGYHRSQDAAARLASILPGAGHFALAAPVTNSMALA
ncbi:MAG TPA: SDR family NAD(P)-dependent oxidoreductase, partial [Steroidobacteraceae bacterium]